MIVRYWIAAVLFVIAAVFLAGGVYGLNRYRDPYARLQAGALAGTTAVITILAACLVLASSWAIAGRVLIILVFFLLSSPTASHLIARFAWNSDVLPWQDGGKTKSGDRRRSGGERP